jgi:hypothetical protein
LLKNVINYNMMIDVQGFHQYYNMFVSVISGFHPEKVAATLITKILHAAIATYLQYSHWVEF